jgi:DNA-binding MarR family transcriptional regulator
MALQGNLRDFSITQLLNLIHLARKTGSLIIDQSSNPISLYFIDGKYSYAQDGNENISLAFILHKSHRLSVQQFRLIKERASGMDDKELGLLLINGNYLNQREILSSLQHHYISILHDLFDRSDGAFIFKNEDEPPNGKITVRINLENIIIEGTRRMQELEHLQDEIPSLDMALKFTDRPDSNIRNVNLSVNEWRVVSYINPKNTMRQIAFTIHMSEMEIRRIVYGLLQAGLVEITRPEGALSRDISQHSLSSSKLSFSHDEQKSLINRIIERIRSL